MNGPSCLKLLEKFPLIANLSDDKEEEEKFTFLFDSLNIIVGFIFSISPLRFLDLDQREWEFLHGPLSNPGMLESDLQFLKSICHQHGNYFRVAFQGIPTPKHHFLVFHVPQFVELFGSVGDVHRAGDGKSARHLQHSESKTPSDLPTMRTRWPSKVQQVDEKTDRRQIPLTSTIKEILGAKEWKLTKTKKKLQFLQGNE